MADNAHLTDVQDADMPDDTLRILRDFCPRYMSGLLDDVSYEAVVVLRVAGDDVQFKGSDATDVDAFEAAQAAIEAIFVSPNRVGTEEVPLSQNRQHTSAIPRDFHPNGHATTLRHDGSRARVCVEAERPQSHRVLENTRRVPPLSMGRSEPPTSWSASRDNSFNSSQGERNGSSNRPSPARQFATHGFNSSAPQTTIVLLPTPQIRAAPYCSNAPSAYAHNMGNTPSEAGQNSSQPVQQAPPPRRKRKSRLLASTPAPSGVAAVPSVPRFATRAPAAHSTPPRTAHHDVRSSSKTTQPPSNQASTSIHRRAPSAQREAPLGSTKRKVPKHASTPSVHQNISFKPAHSRNPTPSKKNPAPLATSRSIHAQRTPYPVPKPTRPVGNDRAGSAHHARANSHMPLANLSRPSRVPPPQRHANLREPSRPYGAYVSSVEDTVPVPRKRVRPQDRMERISLANKRPTNANEHRQGPAPPGLGSYHVDLPAPQRIPRDPAAPKDDSSSYDDVFKQVHSGKSRGPQLEPVTVDISKLGRKRVADIVAGVDGEVQSKRRKVNGTANEDVAKYKPIRVDDPLKVLEELVDRKTITWKTEPFIGGFTEDERPLHGIKLTVEFRSRINFAVKATATSLGDARTKTVAKAVHSQKLRPFVKKLLRKKRKEKEKKETASPMVTRAPSIRVGKNRTVSSKDDSGVKFFNHIREMDSDKFMLPLNYRPTLAKTDGECADWIDKMLGGKRQRVGVYFEASEIHVMLGAPALMSVTDEKVIALATTRGALLCIQNASTELEWPPPAIADVLNSGRHEVVAFSPYFAMTSDEFLPKLQDLSKVLSSKLKKLPFKEMVTKVFRREVGDLYAHWRVDCELRARPAVKVAAITLALFSYLSEKRGDRVKPVPNGGGRGHDISVAT